MSMIKIHVPRELDNGKLTPPADFPDCVTNTDLYIELYYQDGRLCASIVKADILRSQNEDSKQRSSNIGFVMTSSAYNDILACDALYRYNWHKVMECMKDGVSRETSERIFWTAVRRNHWDCAREVAKTEVSPEKRNIVIREDVRNCRWVLATELVKLGVSIDEEELTIRELVNNKLWVYVRWLAVHSMSLELRMFVIIHAIKNCQWVCVLDLVKQGGFTAEQKESICEEAMACGHWDVVAELSRQGMCENYLHNVAHNAFKWNQGLAFKNLLRQRDVNVNLKLVLLSSSNTFRQASAFVHMVKFRDQELTEIMTKIMDNKDIKFLCVLINAIDKGRRVFKHLCMKQHLRQDLSTYIFDELRREGEIDLAFHVAVTQELWDLVHQLFLHFRVSMRACRFAFLRAVRQGAWQHVRLMTRRYIISKRDRRFAFLEAVRQGECDWALKLYQRSAVSDAEIELAVMICTSQGQWGTIVPLCQLCRNYDTLAKVLVDVVHEGIQCQAWQCIRRLFLTTFNALDSSDIFLEESSRRFLLTETPVLQHEQSWNFSIPCLATCFRELQYDELEEPEEVIHFLEECLEDIDSTTLSTMVDWCLKNAFGSVAVLIAVVKEDWDHVDKLTEELQGSIDSLVIQLAIERSILRNVWETAANLFKFATSDAVFPDIFHLLYEEEHVLSFTDLLRQRGLTKWVVTLASMLARWDLVEKEIETADDEKLIVHTIKTAAFENNWTFVNRLLDRCADDNFLTTILKSAVERGKIDSAAKLMSKVNPLSATSNRKTLLWHAVDGSGSREDIVRLCIDSGLSTHQCVLEEANDYFPSKLSLFFWCERFPMRKALYNGQLLLVKLLYASGSCTNCELFRLKRNPELQARLESQGHHDMLQFVDMAATTPRALQDLSRLTVSHLIGCKVGRRDRVYSLPVSEIIKSYILFEDILH